MPNARTAALRPARLVVSAALGLWLCTGLGGCPAPAPASTQQQAGESRPEPSGPTPSMSTPTPSTPAPSSELPVPAAIAGEDVRPVIRELWRAIEAVDAGEPQAMARAMTDDARWFPPGSADDSVGVDQLHRAMAPWTSEGIDLELRRVIDPGGSSVIAQLSVAEADGRRRYEMVLRVEAQGDRIAAIRHYGDPLGPVRLGPAAVDPLRPWPEAPLRLVRGDPPAEAEALARSLAAAIDRRDDEATRALLAPTVVIHDVRARKTRRGPDDYLTAYRADLGARGHLTIAHHYAGSQYVMVEGALQRDEADEAAPAREHGFADVHRLEDGKIAETWHYLNRRDRPPPTPRGRASHGKHRAEHDHGYRAPMGPANPGDP